MHNTRTRNPNFLVKPDPNPTQSQKALLVKAWSLVHFCANNNFQSYLKRFAKTIYNPNEMEKNMIWRFDNILEWIRRKIKRKQMKKPNGQQDHSPSSLVEVLNFNPFYHNRRVSSHNSHPLTHHTSIHSTFNFWRSKSVNSFNKRVQSRILF